MKIHGWFTPSSGDGASAIEATKRKRGDAGCRALSALRVPNGTQVREEAEDVLQASYLKILEGRARFDGRSSVKTWLFGVIRRTAAEERRRSLFRRRMHDSHAMQSPLTYSSDDAISDDPFVTALTLLAPRQREVLHLVFYQGLTIEEAARVMHVSVGTARTHYERGKQRLRIHLGHGKP